MNKINIVFTALFLFTFSSFAEAQNGNNKILFLKFIFVKGEPRLIEMEAVKGKLKVPKKSRFEQSGINYEVLSNKNKSLFTGNINDPSNEILEYPSENGEIKSLSTIRDSVEITVRVPYCASIDKIVLHRRTSKTTLSKSGGKPNEISYSFNVNHSLIKKE